METQQLKLILEGALLASSEPLPVNKLADLFDLDEKPENAVIKEALLGLQEDCEDRGYELVEVASGWRFQVRQQFAQWVNKLWDEKPAKYTRATLETLALIAYRQPITRGDIEDVRGVAVSSNIIQSLLERQWIRVIGHRDVPGRPALYATTKQFLDYFNLSSLEQLPSLSEIRDLDKINEELEFDMPAVEGQEGEDSDSEEGDNDNSAEANADNAEESDKAQDDDEPQEEASAEQSEENAEDDESDQVLDDPDLDSESSMATMILPGG